MTAKAYYNSRDRVFHAAIPFAGKALYFGRFKNYQDAIDSVPEHHEYKKQLVIHNKDNSITVIPRK